MRYAIFSDVHANRQAWEAVRGDVLHQRVSTLVCLGDVVGYGPRPLEVLSSVREATQNFVLGNHDAAACGRLDAAVFNPRARAVIDWTRQRLDDEALEFLNRLPLRMEGEGIEFVHAQVREPGEFGYIDGPGPAGESLRAMTQSLAFIGHTHMPVVYTMPERGGQVEQLPPIDFKLKRGRRTLVNVGSVGEPRTTDVRASYVIYDDLEQTVSFRHVIFDVDGYRQDLAEVGLDIQPYFVQVVDAGRVAGARTPTAGPQMAMAELPKVSEVVAGHQERIVPGRPVGAAAAVPSLNRPRKSSRGLMATVVVMVVLGLGLITVFAIWNQRKSVAAKKRVAARVAQSTQAAGRGRRVDANGSLKNLKVKLFARNIESLRGLRELEKSEFPLQESAVTDGLLSLSHGMGLQSYGLVWDGELMAPKPGVYEFGLECDDGAALFLDGRKALEIDDQPAKPRQQTAEIELGTAPTRFRLEFIQAGGEARLDLTWTGPRAGRNPSPPPPPAPAAEKSMPVVAEDPVSEPAETEAPPPEQPAPRPPPQTASAAMLSQDLLSYWSFDGDSGTGNRVEQRPDGSVRETLVAETNQHVQALVPKKDIGTAWRGSDFGASDWIVGQNGVGYEDKPGDYKDLIRTVAGGAPKKQPNSIYVRIPFKIEDPAIYAGLALYMKFEDGFVAFLNGQPMASKNAPVPLRWNSASTAANGDKEAVIPELFKVNGSLRHLKKGWNVLAIHGLNTAGEPNDSNTGSTSSDLLILPTLIALRQDDGSPESVEAVERSSRELSVAREQIKGKVDLTAGRFGDAYSFNGGSIEIGDREKYSIGDRSFSVSLWFRTEKNRKEKESCHLISSGAEGGGWALLLNRSSDTLSFQLSDGKKSDSIEKSARNLTNDTWWHVVATVDRPSGMVQLYLSGGLLAGKCVDFVGRNAIESSKGLAIGRNSADKQHYRGNLDDVAIWRRNLVPAEVDRIFKHGRGLGSILNGETE